MKTYLEEQIKKQNDLYGNCIMEIWQPCLRLFIQNPRIIENKGDLFVVNKGKLYNLKEFSTIEIYGFYISVKKTGIFRGGEEAKRLYNDGSVTKGL